MACGCDVRCSAHVLVHGKRGLRPSCLRNRFVSSRDKQMMLPLSLSEEDSSLKDSAVVDSFLIELVDELLEPEESACVARFNWLLSLICLNIIIYHCESEIYRRLKTLGIPNGSLDSKTPSFPILKAFLL